MKTAALILAAGRGIRAGGDRPKQWQPLAGRRVIDWSLAAFAAAPKVDAVLLVLHPDDMALAPAGAWCVPGGACRAASVACGLAALAQAGPPDRVLIHDGARPCVGQATIAALLAALDDGPAAAPGVAVTDALWQGVDGQVTGTRDRTGLFRAQTPQAFRFDAIRAAHRAHPGGADDDVAVARAAGLPVRIVPGHADNLKITHPADFVRAERILADQMDIRTGSGYDVHRFGAGDHVMLCGVAVPHGRGLQGHSDADVGLHALSDAIYGALAMGDIGQHFPPSDPQWKGAESHVFLRHAVALATGHGFAVSNMDVTLICERPKIGPHAGTMRAALAGISGVDPQRISVKATTTERLGFTGREEGIAAQAVVTLTGSSKR